jgi:hypothetical protein
MTCPWISVYRRSRSGALVAALLFAAGACSDRTGPATEASSGVDSTLLVVPTDSLNAAPVDSTAIPEDSSGIRELTTSSQLPGIVFGVHNMAKEYLSSVLTGTAQGGAIDQRNILSLLSYARSKGARVVMKMSMGRDMFIKNADGTFSFTKWKALVDRFRSVDLAPYVADGTILGHYLIDEPSRAERWGGKIISPTQIEAMAKYSKSIWRTLPTLARVVPSWLAKSPITYTYLDAGWFQYAARMGSPTPIVAAEVAAAKLKGLGLVASMNVLDGGNGSSGLRGYSTGKWKMSATEVRNYGTALLNQSYVCGFFTWTWDATYYGRSDVKSAMSALSSKAKAHARTSCRQ